MFKNHEIFINKDLCTKCKACVDICPSRIYKIDSSGEIIPLEERFSICISCAQCMSVCKPMAVNSGQKDYEKDFTDIDNAGKVKYEDYIKTLLRRRSVRAFKNVGVEQEKIDAIAESLRYAPYGVSPDKAEVTVIANRDLIEEALPLMQNLYSGLGKLLKYRIFRFIFRKMAGRESGATVVNFLYPLIKAGYFYKKGEEDRISRGAPVLLLFHGEKYAEEHTADSWILLNYAMLSAHFMGLGTTIIGLIPPAVNKNKKIKTLFNIPENHEVVCSLIMGYPRHSYLRSYKPQRRRVNVLK